MSCVRCGGHSQVDMCKDCKSHMYDNYSGIMLTYYIFKYVKDDRRQLLLNDLSAQVMKTLYELDEYIRKDKCDHEN